LVDAHQVVAEFLESMELGDLLLCLAQRGWIGESLRHGHAGYSSSQSELRIMTGIVEFGAMAGRLAAAPDYGSNGAGPKITQAQELLQELSTVGLQGRDSVRHFTFLSERYYTLRFGAQKKKKGPDATPTSHTLPERGSAAVGRSLLKCEQQAKVPPDNLFFWE
jgi:hypothetical protein